MPEYEDQVQLNFEIEIISRDTDLVISLFYKNNKLYYADSFGDITDNEFSIAYVNISYKIITTSQLTLYIPFWSKELLTTANYLHIVDNYV